MGTHELVPSSRSPVCSSSAIVSSVAMSLCSSRLSSLLSSRLPPELLAIHFADRRQREVRDDSDLARILVRAEAALRVVHQLALLELDARAYLDECHDLLAVRLVGTADHAGRLDSRVLEQRVFDVAREDVEAAPDDQVLLAIDDEQVAVGVEVAHVTRVQPSAAQRLGRE